MKEFLRDNLIVCKPEEVVESICDAMGKTLKGFATEKYLQKFLKKLFQQNLIYLL